MLDGVQKLNYLRAQLQGDAARVVAGLPLTTMNYSNAITLLTKRFGQPHKIINTQMQALLDVTTLSTPYPAFNCFTTLLMVIFED